MTADPDPVQTNADPIAPKLVALVGSRIAHDLNNPLGAIANGVELLEMTGSAGGEEMALIRESLANARRRLQRFRLAFGDAQPGQSVSAAEIAPLLDPGPDRRAPRIDWPLSDAVPRSEAKVVLLGLMCLESALPWGGEIAVAGNAAGWRLTARAERLQIAPGLWHHLQGGPLPEDLTASAVHFALLAQALAQRGRAVALTGSDTHVELGF